MPMRSRGFWRPLKETARLAWENSYAFVTGLKYPQKFTQKLILMVLVVGFYYYYYYYVPKHELRLSFSGLTVSFVDNFVIAD
jgi:hypothetical protein